jgi:hypothetical protein
VIGARQFSIADGSRTRYSEVRALNNGPTPRDQGSSCGSSGWRSGARTPSPDGIIHLQKVAVGRDYGDRLEILQGVQEGTTIVAVADDTAREGATIVPVDAGRTRK